MTNQPGGLAATQAEPASTDVNAAVNGESRMRRLIARFKIARQSAPDEGGTASGTPPAPPEDQDSEGQTDPERTKSSRRPRPHAASSENVLGWTDHPRRDSRQRDAAGPGQASGQEPGADTRSDGAQRGRARAWRQRNLSARTAADRVKAQRETAVRRRSAAAAAADLLWTRVPEKPTRYRLGTRLSDMRHGWLDGKTGLPKLPELPKPVPLGESATPIHQENEPPFPAPTAMSAVAVSNALPAVSVEPALAPAMRATPPTWLQTPRMVLFCRRALELIRAEEQACITDCAAYRREISRFRKLRDAAAEDLNQARAALALAQRPLTEHELSARRLAEQSTQDRPDSLVRGRRQAQWDRRLAAAIQAVKVATAQLADATREAELRDELIRDRIAMARAAALRHQEFHLRRTATYLQQLVRTHKQGADLNMLLMRYPVGPDLPEWTRNPHTSDGANSQ